MDPSRRGNVLIVTIILVAIVVATGVALLLVWSDGMVETIENKTNSTTLQRDSILQPVAMWGSPTNHEIRFRARWCPSRKQGWQRSDCRLRQERWSPPGRRRRQLHGHANLPPHGQGKLRDHSSYQRDRREGAPHLPIHRRWKVPRSGPQQCLPIRDRPSSRLAGRRTQPRRWQVVPFTPSQSPSLQRQSALVTR